MVLSHELKVEMRAERSGIPVLDLLRIEDDLLDAPILLVNNTEDFVHQSETYRKAEFTLARGPEGSAPADCTINIKDFDQSILLKLESIPSIQEEAEKTIVRFSLVKSDNPDFVELTEEYELRSYEVGDDSLLVLTVLSDPYMAVTIPAHGFTPDLFPSLFPTISGE